MATTNTVRKATRRTPQLWLAGLAGPAAKRIRAAAGDALAVKRFDARELPAQAEYDRASPQAVFFDRQAWAVLRENPPSWLACARRVLVLEPGRDAGEEPLSEGGFVACLTQPLTKTRILQALDAARQSQEIFEDISRILGDAQRERAQIIQENGRLAFFQHMLARAMGSLDLAAIIAGIRDDLGLAFPVSEVLGVFWDQQAESELYITESLAPQAKAARTDYLLDLAARLRGSSARSYRVNGVSGGPLEAAVEPGRALLVPLRSAEAAFGCLSVLIHRDLAKHEQETARQAVVQLTACLKNALEYLRLSRRAGRDGLTNLPNRRSLDARLEQELKRHMRHKEGFAVILADLDHFKKVNDTHGHLAGDAALRHAAQALEGGLRATDYLARYGGEEFVAILPHTGASQAWMLAERLRLRLASRELRYAGRVIALTVSMGLATFSPGQAATPASLLGLADQAMYASKRSGRNRVSIAPLRPTREDGREAVRAVGQDDGLMAG